MRRNKQDIIENWQKDKRRKVPDADKLLFCSGCRDNFYNGRNPYNIKQCWHLKKAKLKEREIYFSIHQVKPTPVITLSCFHPDRK